MNICGSHLSGVVIFQCVILEERKESGREVYADESVTNPCEEQDFLSSRRSFLGNGIL